MNSISREAEILKAVASGATLLEAGASFRIGSTRTGVLLSKICRKLGMSSAIKDIRVSPNEYLKKLEELEKEPYRYSRSGKELPEWTHGLSTKIAKSLIAAGFNSKEQVVAGLCSGAIGLIPGTSKGTIFGIAQQGIQEIVFWSGIVIPEQSEITKAIKLLESHGYKISKT